MFQTQFDKKGIALRVSCEEALPLGVHADRQKLQQILINLTGNALKFTEEGHISVRAWQDSDLQMLRVDVADTGTGIDATHCEQIFERFEQTEDGRMLTGGTGLGLPISREFARMMGGDITVSSELGKGTTFHVSIAVSPPVGELRAEVIQSSEIPAFSGRCLIVDDVPSNVEILKSLLVPTGLKVQSATCGKEALEVLRQQDFDLVLLDLKMPDMDGDQVFAEANSASLLKNTRVVIVTANDLLGEEERLIAAGLDAFLAKPFSSAQLYQIIAPLIEQAPTPENSNSSDVPESAEHKLTSQETPVAAPSPEHAAVSETDDPTILIVEDNESLRSLFCETAEMLGFRVAEAPDGSSGLAAWQQNPTDFILTDYQMPGMNGLDMTKAIREVEGNVGTRPVIVGATGQIGDTDLGIAAGMDHVLIKPFQIEDLEKVIERSQPEPA